MTPTPSGSFGDGDGSNVEEMLQDPDFVKLMQDAGVTGPPQFWVA
jgi:hypothetical protein